MNTIAKDAGCVDLEYLVSGSRNGFSLQQEFYQDTEIFDRDLERVFFKQWLLTGHVSRIPDVGDYFLFEIGGESIIIIRQSESEVSAFYNVCRHRGSRICLEPSGHKRFLTCPYHSWAYNLDGSLKVARAMPEGFDGAEHGLHKAHVRLLSGFIFLNLSLESPPDFDALYSEYLPLLDFHGFNRAKVAFRNNYPTAANWKLVVENFIECYHCASAHPEYCSVHPSDKLLAYGAGPGSGPEEAERAYKQKLEAWSEKARAMGHPDIFVQDDETSTALRSASRYPINEVGAKSETLDGDAACKRLMGSFVNYDGGESAFCFNPFSYVLAFNDFAVMFRFTPRGPQLSDVELTWLVDAAAESPRDYDVDRLIKVWDITIQQDKTITENNQRGILSRKYQPGPYSEHERLVNTFVRWYLGKVAS